MKKLFSMLLIAAMIALSATALVACGKSGGGDGDSDELPDITEGSYATAPNDSGYGAFVQLHEDGTYYANILTTISVGEYEIVDEEFEYTANDNAKTADRTIIFDGTIEYAFDVVDDVHVIVDFEVMVGWNETLTQNPDVTHTETAVAIAEYFLAEGEGESIELMSDFSFIYWELGSTADDAPYTGTWSKAIASGNTTYTLVGSNGGAQTTMTILVTPTAITLTHGDNTIALLDYNPATAKVAILELVDEQEYVTGKALFYIDGTFEIVVISAAGTYIVDSGTYTFGDLGELNLTFADESTETLSPDYFTNPGSLTFTMEYEVAGEYPMSFEMVGLFAIPA